MRICRRAFEKFCLSKIHYGPWGVRDTKEHLEPVIIFAWPELPGFENSF